MKISSYNLRSGGFESYNFKTSYPEKIEEVQKAISTIGADFMSIVDTFRWDAVFTNDDLIKLFNYLTVFNIKLEDDRLKSLGHDNGITVLTNFIDADFKQERISTRNCLRSRITKGSKVLDIFSVYLDDVSEDTRLAQVKDLLTHVDANIPTIMIGDFNTFSLRDLDKVDEYVNEFRNTDPERYKMYEDKINEMKKGEVVKLLELNGYFDSARVFVPTAPTKLIPNVTKKGLVRIDYAFVSPGVQVMDFSVLNDDLFDEVSDHYPITLDIEF